MTRLPRFRATRCPEVETLRQGQRVWVFNATAIGHQFGINDRLLITKRALDAFVPLRMRTDDHQVLHVALGLRSLFPLDRSVTRFAWESRPDSHRVIRLIAEYGHDQQSYRFLADLNCGAPQ